MSNSVEIAITFIRRTEKAFLVRTVDYENEPLEVWVPRSQVETDCFAEGDEGTMTLPEWLAEEKGLI